MTGDPDYSNLEWSDAYGWRPRQSPTPQIINTQPMADDDGRLSLEDVTARLRGALDALRSVATSGHETIDAQILEAEVSLRRAIAAIRSLKGAKDNA